MGSILTEVVTSIAGPVVDKAIANAKAADVEKLGALVVETYEAINDREAELRFGHPETPVTNYLTEPAQQYVAARVVAGHEVARNAATAKALAGAAVELAMFYDNELT